MNGNKFLQNKYKLRDTVYNAFAAKVTQYEHLVWWTNRKEEMTKWEVLIKKSIGTNVNHMQFIIGDYGRGKTLSLLKIIELSSNKHKNAICSVFLNLKGEEKSTPGIDLIFKIFRSIDFQKVGINHTREVLAEKIKELPDELADFRKVLWAIYFGNLKTDQLEMWSGSNLPQNDLSDLALHYLRGLISPSASQLKQIGVLKKIDKIDIAKEYFFGFLMFLRKLDYKTLLLAIDEFEGLFALVSKSQQAIYVALLRSLYDFPMGINIQGEIANLLLFFGISEAGWSSLQEMEKKENAIGGPTVPFMDRVEKSIVLTNLNLHHTTELIERRLKFNRIDGDFAKEPLIPFTTDFVEFIFEVTEGVPRYIIETCGLVLDEGISKKVNRLDRKFADNVLKEWEY